MGLKEVGSSEAGFKVYGNSRSPSLRKGNSLSNTHARAQVTRMKGGNSKKSSGVEDLDRFLSTFFFEDGGEVKLTTTKMIGRLPKDQAGAWQLISANINRPGMCWNCSCLCVLW